MQVSDASDASDALGNFLSPKKKIYFFCKNLIIIINYFPIKFVLSPNVI